MECGQAACLRRASAGLSQGHGRPWAVCVGDAVSRRRSPGRALLEILAYCRPLRALRRHAALAEPGGGAGLAAPAQSIGWRYVLPAAAPRRPAAAGEFPFSQPPPAARCYVVSLSRPARSANRTALSGWQRPTALEASQPPSVHARGRPRLRKEALEVPRWRRRQIDGRGSSSAQQRSPRGPRPTGRAAAWDKGNASMLLLLLAGRWPYSTGPRQLRTPSPHPP